MTSTALALLHRWPQRLIDRLRRLRFHRLAGAPGGDPGWSPLDVHMLRDLGIDASEIGSIAAEAAGTARGTRRRIVGRGPGQGRRHLEIHQP